MRSTKREIKKPQYRDYLHNLFDAGWNLYEGTTKSLK